MLHRLIRHRRWRQAVLAIFLPYALASLFVDFFHVHQPAGTDVPRLLVPAGAAVANVPTRTPIPQNVYACPACFWLRLSSNRERVAAVRPALHIIGRDLVQHPHLTPRLLALQPSAFRAPPASTLT